MKILKFFSPFFLAIPFLFVSLSKANAAEFHFKSYTLEEDQTVEDDVYAFGDSVEINGVIDGDLIVAAESVKINGTITGDVYAAGELVNINSTIYGDTFLAGNNTTVDGILNSNVYIFSNILSYLAESSKDVLSFASQTSFKGSVGDDLRSFSMSSTIDSIIRGDLILFASQYDVEENKVSNNIYYDTTLKNIAEEQGIDFDKNELKIDSIITTNYWGLKGFQALVSFVLLLVTGAFLIYLTPVKTVQIRRKITNSPDEFIKSLLTGLCTFILIPFPLFLLLISIIGAPIAGIILAFLIFVMLFGRIWVELAFGKEILELFGVKSYRPYRSFLVGRVISVGIGLIPVVKDFYNIIIIFVALGAIIRMKKDFFRIAKKEANISKKEVVKKK